MTDLTLVLERFALLAGLSAQEAAPWEPLARSCAARLEARLRPEVNPAGHEEALALAAAGMLLCEYAAAAPAGKIQLGDLSLSGGGLAPANPQALREELMAGVRPLLACPEAFLLQVDG